jgi:hypothetical protein
MTDASPAATEFARERRSHPTWHYLVKEFTEALALSPAQLTKIQPALDQAGERLTRIRLEAMKNARLVINETITQIRPILSEDQRRNVDTWQRIEQALSRAREIEQRAG